TTVQQMGLYRNIVWFIKGMREYTSFVEKDLDVSMVGCSFMITGANSGIAMAIDKKGGTVYIVCRNKMSHLLLMMLQCLIEVYIHVLDLFETRKVWEFAEAFKKEHSSLNVLINNAGYWRKILLSNDDDLLLNTRYVSLCARPQRQQVVMTEVWAKANPKIHFSVMHPGWTDTPAVAKVMPQFHQMMRDRLRSAEQGANTVTTALPSGLFFQDRRPVSAHLPLAWTHSSRRDVKAFMGRLENLAMAVKPSD
uniref:Si:ch211-165b10.3 n=2 Tax=Cyprinus carpio TaxID=7962 RepID=A0A8C1YBR5_CYPCA